MKQKNSGIRFMGFTLLAAAILFAKIASGSDDIGAYAIEKKTDKIGTGSSRECPCQGKIHELESRIRKLEAKIEKKDATEPVASKKPVPEQFQLNFLVREELGSVKGTVYSRSKPLPGGLVAIELETYTGMSIEAVKNYFRDVNGATFNIRLFLKTRADPNGHFDFPEVPPGFYRVFWQDAPGTGWIRRLREKPDIKVVSGKQIVHNIPK